MGDPAEDSTDGSMDGSAGGSTDGSADGSAGGSTDGSADGSAGGSTDDPTPNERQRELIRNTEGTYVVDAGAGTGKTFAVTRRYANIVDKPAVEPADVLLVTFTRSGATEMRERIVDRSAYSLRELADASVQTFHAHCVDLLREHGFRAPTHLDIDERITGSTRVVEDDLAAADLFGEFLDRFRESHPEHADVFRAVSDLQALRDVVGELASRGVFPTADGWYRDGEDALDGDLEAFRERFDAVNEPRNDGRKQSVLREKLRGYDGDRRTYHPDAPEKADVRGERTKQVPDEVAELAFSADRTALKRFVHDLYVEYLEFALSRDYLTFGFLQCFAYVLLREDAALRERVAFDYVMVDEFQDTSEVQFKLALLLAGTDNLCVVGDWKQSIYSFQYADVENIRSFEDRLERFAAELGLRDRKGDGDHNGDGPGDGDGETVRDHPGFDADAVERIELRQNYRSTGTVLDFSEAALVAPASSTDEVDDPAAVRDDVVSLSSNAPFDRSTIEGIAHPNEHEAVLTAVQDIVGNDDYAVADGDGEPRPPKYSDVAVLTRTRDFGRELLRVADGYEFPMAYDGGVELFRTDQAKLLLAWLRVLDADDERGWAVVLEEIGYTMDEIDHVLETSAYPANLTAFRETLAARSGVGAVARAVFDRYGFTGEHADAVLHAIQSLHDASTRTRGDLIRCIERGIERGTTREVPSSAGVGAVTVQTIHAAKGREYPIVVLANMNEGAFPPRGASPGVIRYQDPVGIRQRKRYATVDAHAHPHVYDDWTHDVIRHCLPRGFDEERRLLYVAVTRAEHHVVFAGGEEPNAFFDELPMETRSVEPAVEPVDRSATAQAQLPFAIVPPEGPTSHTPHTLMDDGVFETAGDDDVFETAGNDEVADPPEESVAFRGRAFGSRVHEFAEAYATGDAVAPPAEWTEDERNVAAFLDERDGTRHVEERAVLPLDVDGERVTVAGVVDLVHETAEAVEVVDYKTDRRRRGAAEYRKQLSVYVHVVRECFPGKDVTASVFYTATGETEPVDPLSTATLRDLVREARAEGVAAAEPDR